jgi:hypothetical protein
MGKKLILVAVGLSISNVIYQFLTGNNDWDIAFDRSYVQCLAMVPVYFALKG